MSSWTQWALARRAPEAPIHAGLMGISDQRCVVIESLDQVRNASSNALLCGLGLLSCQESQPRITNYSRLV
jgi:hypothetical protein